MARWLPVFILISVSLLGGSREVHASAQGMDPAQADPHAAGAKASPPAQNPIEPRFDIMIWTIVVFALLLLVLRKFAWGPMLSGLQKREESIRNALDEAKRAQEDAHKLREQLQAETNKSQERARDILDQARKDAQHSSDEMLAKARSEIQNDRDRARRDIETAKDQALQEVWKQTAEVASLISSKAIRRNLSIEDHRRLVDDALSEFRQAGQQRRRGA